MQGIFRCCLLLSREIVKKMNEILGEYGLSYSHWVVVYYVKNQGSSTLVDISNHVNVKKPVITRSVHALEDKGIVQQIPSEDKREKIIELTELGEGIYQVCRKVIDQLECTALEGISQEEKNAIFKNLVEIRDNLMGIGGNKIG